MHAKLDARKLKHPSRRTALLMHSGCCNLCLHVTIYSALGHSSALVGDASVGLDDVGGGHSAVGMTPPHECAHALCIFMQASALLSPRPAGHIVQSCRSHTLLGLNPKASACVGTLADCRRLSPLGSRHAAIVSCARVMCHTCVILSSVVFSILC